MSGVVDQSPSDPVQIIAEKNVWCVDTRTHVVNHWCKEHCIINNDVNLKFCRDSRVCGSCTLWGGGGGGEVGGLCTPAVQCARGVIILQSIHWKLAT